MRAADVHSCCLMAGRSGTLPLRNPRTEITRATCKLPANTLLLRSALKLEGIYGQAIPGASLVVYSSLLYSLLLLINRTQNSPLVTPILAKLCKVFGAWRSQYNQSLLIMKYLHLRTQEFTQLFMSVVPKIYRVECLFHSYKMFF